MESGYYGVNYGKIDVGAQPVDTRTFDELIGGDRALPVNLSSPENGGGINAGPIPFARYYDPKYVELEKRYIWSKVWQVACREEDIPDKGDRIVYDIADQSFIVVRQDDDDFKAFYNSCPHRGRTLCNKQGSGREIRCAYHGWTWSLSGNLEWIPGEADFPHVKPENYALPQVRVARWGGQVFINPDPEAPDLEAALGVLTQHFSDFPLENRYTAFHMRKKVRANWKAAQEAFMESYHVMETHWDVLPFAGDSQTRYDVWDTDQSHVSRLITPGAVSSAYMGAKLTSKQVLDYYLAAMGGGSADLPDSAGIEAVRDYAAGARRAAHLATTGHEHGSAPNAFWLDMSKYFMFPNFHPWWGEGLPLWYRFLPNGLDPETCVMEVRLTAEIPAGSPALAPAPIMELDYEDRCEDIAALGSVGHILDQDMDNLPEVQKGYHAANSRLAFNTLARRQECNVAHFHKVYAELLAPEGDPNL